MDQKTFLIKIEEIGDPGDDTTVYLRRVTAADVTPIIVEIDGALHKLPVPRKPRKDAGKKRGEAV